MLRKKRDTVCLILSLLLVVEAMPAGARRGDSLTAQQYLATNAAKQRIFVSRQMNAQKKLVAECTPGMTAEAFAAYLAEWIEARPQYLNRPAQLAFTLALADKCKAAGNPPPPRTN